MLMCKRCGKKQARIETAEDSNFKIVKCLACGWWMWLKWYNK